MHIDGISEIEIADENMDYDRVKLNIGFDSEEESREVWKAIKDHNKEVEESYWNKFDPTKDLLLIAYLHYNHKTKTVTVENNLLSAYFDGEWDFPNSWLNPHALERCKEYVAEIYKEHTLVGIYNEHGLFCTSSRYNTAEKLADKVKELYYEKSA